MSPHSRRLLPRLPRRLAAGQSLVEFAIITPVVLLLLVGISDLGRLFASAVAIESAAREAADYGSFDASYWTPTNYLTTVDEMRRRACVAASGSHLQDYETTDPVNHSSCTNPSFTCTLERNGSVTDCATSVGITDGVDCSNPATEPPCTVHVGMSYQFRLILALPPFPASIQIDRESFFRISNLQPPPGP